MAVTEIARSESLRGELIREAREVFRRGFIADFGRFFSPEEVGFIESWFITKALETYSVRRQAIPNILRKRMTSLRFGVQFWMLEKVAGTDEKILDWRTERVKRSGHNRIERVMISASKAQQVIEEYPDKMSRIESWNDTVEEFFEKLQPGVDLVTEILVGKPVEGAFFLMTKASEILGVSLAIMIRMIIGGIRAIGRRSLSKV